MKYLKNEVDAEDAVMQIFEKLMNDLKKHSIDNFKGWLYMVAKNYCLMQLRGDQSQLKKDKELKKDFPSIVEINYNLHLDGENEKEKSLLQLEAALKELNEEQRICIELFYLKEMCYKEVSELSGFTMNQVKSYIQNGKRNLKIIMEKNNERQTK
jgi:RNA polymerase sigma-70 factor (ECF subfamily)